MAAVVHPGGPHLLWGGAVPHCVEHQTPAGGDSGRWKSKYMYMGMEAKQAHPVLRTCPVVAPPGRKTQTKDLQLLFRQDVFSVDCLFLSLLHRFSI